MMKIITKNSLNNGPPSRHSKATKKSRIAKKIPEKIPKTPSPSNSQDGLPKQTFQKRAVKKTGESEQPAPQKLPEILKNNAQKTQLEKRKQDANEWKALKKIDYQRLETVMEEGQLSSEEASSKHNFFESGRSDSESDTDHAPAEAAPARSKKSWIYSLMSISDNSKTNEDSFKKTPWRERLQHKQRQAQKQQPDQLCKGFASSKQGDMIELGESHGEPTESLSKDLSQNKRSVILSGMMEILPIFSNDKFVCSRDAISLEEYEEPDWDRSGIGSGKVLLEAKSTKDSRTVDIKSFVSASCVRKENSFDGRILEKVGDFKETTERKLRYKVFTDRNVCQQTSSPFINSLLVLTSFSHERERLLNEQAPKDNSGGSRVPAPRDFVSVPEEGKRHRSLKTCSRLALTVLFLLTALLAVAWKSYQPPCFLDSVIEALPFIRPRRSYLQLFLHKLVQLLSSYVGGMYLKFSSSNQISELAV